MGHPQHPIIIQIDSTSVEGFVNYIINQRQSIVTDMCYRWIWCSARQVQFHVCF